MRKCVGTEVGDEEGAVEGLELGAEVGEVLGEELGDSNQIKKIVTGIQYLLLSAKEILTVV